MSIRIHILSFGDAFFCNPVLICPVVSFHAVAATALLISLWLHRSIARLANARRIPDHDLTSHSTSRSIALAASRGVPLVRNQVFLAVTGPVGRLDSVRALIGKHADALARKFHE